MRKLKILAATLAMTLLFAAPAFAAVLDPLELQVGGVHAHTHFLGETEVEAGGVETGTEFLSETEVEAGNLSIAVGFMD